MVELSKTNKITIGVIFFLLIILIGFIFINPPKYSFHRPETETLNNVLSGDYKYNPQLLAEKIRNKDNNVLLVDVRSQYVYNKSHLPEALNIPTVHLLDDDNYKFFKDAQKGGKKVVLYGNTANDASAPFMILHQMGFDNVSYSQVGFEYFEGKDLNALAQETFDVIDEQPVTDFAQFIEDARQKAAEKYNTSEVTNTAKQPVQLNMQAHTEEEDEGC